MVEIIMVIIPEVLFIRHVRVAMELAYVLDVEAQKENGWILVIMQAIMPAHGLIVAHAEDLEDVQFAMEEGNCRCLNI